MRGTEEKDQGIFASKSGKKTQVQNFIQSKSSFSKWNADFEKEKFKKIRKKKLKSKIFPNKICVRSNELNLKSCEQSGITLIALVITIIIMIVLASVSINAIVGDNGIITQAQNATIQNSIANLEEYFQELYVENYDTLTGYSTKVEGLSNIESYKYYFYNPYREHSVGGLSYIVTSDGYVLYLINKSKLPEEIQEQLIGGETGDGNYSDYATLNDVYGITSNLKVYYCSDGIETITGLTVADLDVDNPARSVTINDSGLASLLESLSYINRNSDGTFSAQELRSITELTIDSTSVSSLADLYNLSNLQKLTFENISLTTLDGVQNCPKLYYIYNKGSTLGNYTAVGKLGNQLEYLYFYNITDSELETACSKTVGIGSYDLEKLTNFAVVGNTSYIGNETFFNTSYLYWNYSSSKSTNTITSIEPLENLTDITKEAIKYMSLQNNNITSLGSLVGFNSLILLRAEYNSLTDLSGIEDITSLQYLCVAYNSLTLLTEFAENSGLYSFCVNGNSSLTTLAGLDNCSSLYNLYAMDCDFGNDIELSTGKQETDSLASLDGKTKLYFVDLRNNSNLIWIDYLSSCTAIRILKLDGCTSINSNSMYAIKSIIDTCGENASYDSSYSLALLDSNTTLLDLSGETLSEDEFEVIGNYTGITHLSLKNVVIEDENEDEITNDNDDELDKLVTEVLSNLTAMKYLQVYGMSNLSTIDFVENMNSLIELDVRNTSITDLSLLETMRNAGTMTLRTLAVNVEDTDLSEIPNAISKLGDSTTYWNIENGLKYGGLLCDNASVLQSLNNSSITSLYLGLIGLSGETVDLRGCIALTSFSSYVADCSGILLPNSVKYVTLRSYTPVCSSGTNLTLLTCHTVSISRISKFLANVDSVYEYYGIESSSALSILNLLYDKNIVYFRTLKPISEDLTDLKIPSSLISLRYGYGDDYLQVAYADLKNFPLTVVSDSGTSLSILTIRGVNLSNLSFLNGLTELSRIDLSYNTISSVEGVSSSLANVTILNLSHNNLSSLYGIQYFTGLQTLNISYNTTLADTASYNGGDSFNNLGLLTDLYNTNKTLTSVNLTGCTSITADSTNSYWTALKSIRGLTVTGP